MSCVTSSTQNVHAFGSRSQLKSDASDVSEDPIFFKKAQNLQVYSSGADLALGGMETRVKRATTVSPPPKMSASLRVEHSRPSTKDAWQRVGRLKPPPSPLWKCVTARDFALTSEEILEAHRWSQIAARMLDDSDDSDD